MKKCMNCGFENLDNNLLCVVCNETLTINHANIEEVKKGDVLNKFYCEHCEYPFILEHKYSNCPFCNNIFEKYMPEHPEKGLYQEVSIKLMMHSIPLGEIKIFNNILIFENFNDSPHKKILKITKKPDSASKSIVIHKKTYGKRKGIDTVSFGTEDTAHFFSEDAGLAIQITLTEK